jgi:hypothetical protein
MEDKTPNTVEGIKAQANELSPIAELPTHGNSTKKTAPSFPAGLDSPAPTGNLSC